MHELRQEWIARLQQMELLWTHDGNPKRPHALLTSGGHSNGFFNGGKLLFGDPALALELAQDLVAIANLEPDVCQQMAGARTVLGPAFGAITWVANLAVALNVRCAFTVPDIEGSGKKFKLEKRFNLAGEVVLPAEDVITTGDSVMKTIEVALTNGAEVVPLIVAICNRSGLTEIDGRRIVAMVDKHMENWKPEDCPLCKAGSEAIRPKEAQNWARLSAQY